MSPTGPIPTRPGMERSFKQSERDVTKSTVYIEKWLIDGWLWAGAIAAALHYNP